MPQPIASASYDWENPPLGLGAQTTYDLNGSLATEPFHEPDGSHDDQDIRLQWPGPPVDLPGYGTEPDFPGGRPHRAPQREPVTARGSLTARKVDHLINEADYLYAQNAARAKHPGRRTSPSAYTRSPQDPHHHQGADPPKPQPTSGRHALL